MAYETQTKTAILQRMLDASPSDIDKRQGSVTYDLLSPAAIETAALYIELDNILRWGFADTTYGEYLDRRAGEIGLARKAAVKAAGTLTFTGPSGFVVDAGTEVTTATVAPITFVTSAAGTITGGTVTVPAVAAVAGTSGNVGVGTVTTVKGNLVGVVTATNSSAFSGGVDTETDEALLGRYYERLRTPATSGNANNYKQWAKEIAGILDAKVYPVWNGPGTVKIVLLGSDGTPPTTGKAAEVAAYIETVRPIGAAVTVEPAAQVAIAVGATISLDVGYTLVDVRNAFTSGLTEYLKSLAFVDPLVRYTQVANVLVNTPGVLDFSGLTVNGGTTNVTVADGAVAVVGAVNLT